MNLVNSEVIENYYTEKEIPYIEDKEFNKFIDYWYFKNQSDIEGYFYIDTEEKFIKFYNKNKELLNTIIF